MRGRGGGQFRNTTCAAQRDTTPINSAARKPCVQTYFSHKSPLGAGVDPGVAPQSPPARGAGGGGRGNSLHRAGRGDSDKKRGATELKN